MPDEPANNDIPSPAEQRAMKRLARQAERDARLRRRSAAGRSGTDRTLADEFIAAADTPTEGATNAKSASTGGTPTRRWFRRVALRLALVTAGLMVLMVAWPPFLIPVDGSVTSRFFLRNVPESPFLFDIEHHRGIDIGAPTGTRVGTARTGRVVAVTEDPAYGLVVDIRHPLGMVTRYAHLSEQSVRQGQWVWRGRRIGGVGMTGRATGPHLHFEIRIGERSVPPGFLLVFHQLRRSIFRRS